MGEELMEEQDGVNEEKDWNVQKQKVASARGKENKQRSNQKYENRRMKCIQTETAIKKRDVQQMNEYSRVTEKRSTIAKSTERRHSNN